MSYQKTLCLICECPTADGAVLAVHVDKEKLQTWFLNVCEFEMDEEIEDEDLICYFCFWHAEFQWKVDKMEDDDLVWWNLHLDLDDAAKELRKHYFGGRVEQCWVSLEKVELSESEEEEFQEDSVEEMQPNLCSEKKKCFYCGKLYSYSRVLLQHVKKTHKNAIRCENHNCATYFHTIEQREKHNEEVHEKLKLFKCDFCNKEFKGSGNYCQHVRNVHHEFPVKCAFHGCVSFCKTKIEMRAHFDTVHIIDGVVSCEHCDFKTRKKSNLQDHVARRHTKKTIKCDECGEMFSTNYNLSRHERNVHTFKRCKVCTSSVAVGNFTKHIRKLHCVRCKNKFQCSGLYQLHLKKCRETLFKCSKCPKSFQKPAFLVYHMKRKHGTREWRGLENKALGFKCEPCKRYYKSAKLLKRHSNRMHNQANLKHCAHCPKFFYSTHYLENHLAAKHSLLELEFECDICKKRFISKCLLRSHIMATHLKSNTQEKCGICGKSMLKQNIRGHLLQIHGTE